MLRVETKKVSVVVPIYNAKKYLNKCIDSILAQDYENYEVILIDDGSSDKSSEICDFYMRQDDRINVIHQENKGVAEARNTGLDVSTGEYVVFIDADDWWNISFLSVMVEKMSKSDMVICELVKCLPEGKRVVDSGYKRDKSQWCWPILNNYSISCLRCMFDLSVVRDKAIRFVPGRKTGEDQEFTYRYMLHTHTISYVPEAKYYYRINPNSVMFTANYNHFQAVDAMIAIEEYAKEICCEEKAYEISRVLNCFKYPYILEFAILTVITAGDRVHSVMQYLKENKYYELLNNACRQEQYYDSTFMRMWKKSPQFCLYYYSFRRTIGRIIRKYSKKVK